jgi:hypothetical protein
MAPPVTLSIPVLADGVDMLTAAGLCRMWLVRAPVLHGTEPRPIVASTGG